MGRRLGEYQNKLQLTLNSSLGSCPFGVQLLATCESHCRIVKHEKEARDMDA